MAKKQFFNSVFMTSILAFATLTLVLLLILVNTKKKEKFDAPQMLTEPCQSDYGFSYLFGKYNVYNDPAIVYAALVNEGAMKTYADALQQNMCTNVEQANFVTLSESKLKAYATTPTCAASGMKPVSQFASDSRIKINGFAPPTSLNLKIDAGPNDCYAVINNADDAKTLLANLQANDKFKNEWTKLLDQLSVMIQAKKQQNERTKSANQQLSIDIKALEDEYTRLVALADSQKGTNQTTEKAIKDQEKINARLIADSQNLTDQLSQSWKNAEARIVDLILASPFNSNILIQKKHDGRYFSLLYKYGSDGGKDPATLWYEGLNVNNDKFATMELAKSNIRSTSVNYRNNALMNIVFGSQSQETHILLEIYRFDESQNGGRLAWMLFKKPYSMNDDFNSWFSASNYITGHFSNAVMTQGMQFFGVNGDPRWNRRFFMNVLYSGCGGDPSLMAIPWNGPCSWDQTMNRQIILAKQNAINLGGQTDSFPSINSQNALIGNVMMIWKCRAPPAIDEHVSGATNIRPIIF